MERGHLHSDGRNSRSVVFLLPQDQMLLPLMWGIGGTVTIYIIIRLQALARQLAENKRATKTLIPGAPAQGREYPSIYGRLSGKDKENNSFKSCRSFSPT
jgi:hypothetical protein